MADAAAARGWGAEMVAASPLPGPSGNVEFFLWLRRGPAAHRRRRHPPPWCGRAAPTGVPGEKAGAVNAGPDQRASPPRRVLLLAHTGAARRARCPARSCKALCEPRHRGAGRWPTRPPTSGWPTRRAARDRRRRRPTRPATASWPSSSAATARSCAPPSSPTTGARRCSASTSATSASSPRPSTTTSSRPSTRSSSAATPPRSGSPSTCRCSATASWSCSTFALNEASVEKAARERMLEVVVEVDGRPLSRWGCDGVVCATPTGSTAYNFSAGGPSSGRGSRRC